MSKQKSKNHLQKKTRNFLAYAFLMMISPIGGAYIIAEKSNRRSTMVKIAATVFLFGALFMGLQVVSDFFTVLPLKNGRQIAGTVIEVKKYNDMSYVTYEFTPINGRPIQNVGKYMAPIGPDGKVQVTYLPDDPSDNLLTEDLKDRENDGFIQGLTIFFGIMSALFFGRAYRSKRKGLPYDRINK